MRDPLTCHSGVLGLRVWDGNLNFHNPSRPSFLPVDALHRGPRSQNRGPEPRILYAPLASGGIVVAAMRRVRTPGSKARHRRPEAEGAAGVERFGFHIGLLV